MSTANAPAGRNIDSVSYYAHIAGGVAGVTPTGLIEGAIACNPLDGSIEPNQAMLPAGAAAKGVLGVITDVWPGGVPEGKPCSARYLGLVGINIAANTAVNFGDKLIVANAQGDAKPRTNETDCDIVAVALETIGAQPSRGRVQARLQLAFIP